MLAALQSQYTCLVVDVIPNYCFGFCVHALSLSAIKIRYWVMAIRCFYILWALGSALLCHQGSPQLCIYNENEKTNHLSHVLTPFFYDDTGRKEGKRRKQYKEKREKIAEMQCRTDTSAGQCHVKLNRKSFG